MIPLYCILLSVKNQLFFRNSIILHFIAVKTLLALLRGITSKHHGDSYCLNCFHSFATENKRESHITVHENKGFCSEMPSEDTKILQFNQYLKSNRAPFIIYEDLEQKRLMDVKIILKIHLQQKQMNTFHQVFQFLQFDYLKAQKISMMYTGVKTTPKSFVNP